MPISPRSPIAVRSDAGERLRFVPFAHVRADLRLRRTRARCDPEQRLFVGEREVHRRRIVSSGHEGHPSAPRPRVVVAAPSRPRPPTSPAFIGSTTSPTNRPARGFAVGAGILVRRVRVRVLRYRRGHRGRCAGASDRAWATCCCRRRCRSPASSPTSRPAAAATASSWVRTSTTHVGLNTGGGVKINAGRTAARADRLPGVHVERQPARERRPPAVRRREPGVLSGLRVRGPRRLPVGIAVGGQRARRGFGWRRAAASAVAGAGAVAETGDRLTRLPPPVTEPV